MPKIHKNSIKKQKENFLKSYIKAGGILSPALLEVRITYNTYKKWFTEDEEFRNRCLDVEYVQGDIVETALMSQIEQGNIQAILFYLRCRRKEKWNDKQTVMIEGSIDHTMKQLVVHVTDEETKLLMGETIKLLDKNGNEVE